MNLAEFQKKSRGLSFKKADLKTKPKTNLLLDLPEDITEFNMHRLITYESAVWRAVEGARVRIKTFSRFLFLFLSHGREKLLAIFRPKQSYLSILVNTS